MLRPGRIVLTRSAQVEVLHPTSWSYFVNEFHQGSFIGSHSSGIIAISGIPRE